MMPPLWSGILTTFSTKFVGKMPSEPFKSSPLSQSLLTLDLNIINSPPLKVSSSALTMEIGSGRRCVLLTTGNVFPHSISVQFRN